MFTITYTLIILTCVISASAFNNPRLMNALIFWPPAVNMRHQYYRFVTCGFIHADFLHLAFNMISLYFAGRIMEAYYMGVLGLPHFWYPVLYLGAIVFANIPTYLKKKDDYSYRSLGASGGVCAVLFAFILLRPWERLWVFGLQMPAIVYAFLFLGYTIYMSKKGGDNVNHDAHFWGAAFGVLFTIALDHDVVNIFINELKHPRF